LFELPLHSIIIAAASLAAIPVAHDLVFMLLEFEQRLISGLLGGQSLGQGDWRISGLGEMSESLFHFFDRSNPKCPGARIPGIAGSGFGLIDCLGLGVADDGGVILVRGKLVFA